MLPPEVRREVEYIKEVLLRCGALGAVMSGSGPTVLGLFAGEKETAWAMETLTGKDRQVFLTEPVGQIVKSENTLQ